MPTGLIFKKVRFASEVLDKIQNLRFYNQTPSLIGTYTTPVWHVFRLRVKRSKGKLWALTHYDTKEM